MNFREGDIVRARGMVGEARVTIPGAEVTTVEWLDTAGDPYWRPDALELLRRPVRVGDVLTKPRECRVLRRRAVMGTGSVTGYGASTFEVSESPTLEGPGRGRWALHGMWLDALTHENGAAIEPPQAEPWRPGGPPSLATRYEQIQDLLNCPDGPLISAEDALRLLDMPEPEPSLTHDTLARALFNTDAEVDAFVSHVSEWAADAECCQADFTGPCARCDAQQARYERAQETAWGRDEQGWRSRAVERAEAVLTALGATA